MQLPEGTLSPRSITQFFFAIVCLALGFAPSAADSPLQPLPSQRPGVAREARWYWFGDCQPSMTIGLEILVSSRSIFHSSIPVCRLRSLDVQRERNSPTLAFSFKGGHIFQGMYRTRRNQSIVGNIWQAGAEPDELLLGVSFSTKAQVLLNSVHPAKPDRVSQSKLDRGVVIRTYPVAGSSR